MKAMEAELKLIKSQSYNKQEEATQYYNRQEPKTETETKTYYRNRRRTGAIYI